MKGRWVDFAAVKEAVSLAAVLEWYGVKGLRPSGAEQLRGRCPVHGEGGADAFHASLSKNAFQCFYCQAQGNVLDLVAALERCSVRAAAVRLQEWFEVGEGDPGRRSRGEGKLVPGKEGSNRPLAFQLSGVDAGHPYLWARGIRAETAHCFGAGFYGGRGLMSGRVVIPIADRCGRTVAYVGRAIAGELPKYKLPPGFHKSLELFNLYRAAACGQQTAVVVEGFFDCLQVHQAGYASVVALMGTSLSRRQEELLVNRFRRVVLLLDGDEAGRRASDALGSRLAGRCEIIRRNLAAGTQPDQLSAAQIVELLGCIEGTSETGIQRWNYDSRPHFRPANV